MIPFVDTRPEFAAERLDPATATPREIAWCAAGVILASKTAGSGITHTCIINDRALMEILAGEAPTEVALARLRDLVNSRLQVCRRLSDGDRRRKARYEQESAAKETAAATAAPVEVRSALPEPLETDARGLPAPSA